MLSLKRLFAVPPRLFLLSLFSAIFILLPTFIILRNSFDSPEEHNALWASGSVGHSSLTDAQAGLNIDQQMLSGGVIMPKLANATAKAELGRASWKLLHTMAARYPATPTAPEQDAYRSFLLLFARLYPCGDCAVHFQALLTKYPPQVSSRNAASLHLCFLHNQVNERLHKPEFDCAGGLEGLYDCGCGDDEAGGSKKAVFDPITGEELVGG